MCEVLGMIDLFINFVSLFGIEQVSFNSSLPALIYKKNLPEEQKDRQFQILFQINNVK